MKLTKKRLSQINIHDSYTLAKRVGSRIFLEYVPADNGRLTSHYAYWRYVRFTDEGLLKSRTFTVTCRERKASVLLEVISLVKTKFGINIVDKDVFGGYHPEGTLKKLGE